MKPALLFAAAVAILAQSAPRQIPLGPFPTAAILTPNSRHLLVLHGGPAKPALAVFDPATLTELSRLPLEDAWAGLAVAPNSRTVYVAGAARRSVYELTLSNEGALAAARTFTVPGALLGDLALSPDGRLLFLADLYGDSVKVINPQSGRVIENWRTARRPAKILFHPDGKSFFVSSWADGLIVQHDSQNGAILSRTAAGPHPTDMVWRPKLPDDEEGESNEYPARLFVSLGNANAIRAFGVTASKELRPLESISVALYPDLPAGMTPSALALSPDQNTLYVVCADANAVAAVNVAGGRSRTQGFVPTGRYPTAIRPLDDKRVLVLNGRDASASLFESLDLADVLAWTDQVRAATPFVPALPPDRSAIQHVVYIVTDGRAVGPNHQRIAAEYVTLPNFQPNGDSSATGLAWATAAIAPDFLQRLSGRPLPIDPEPAANPPAGYLWNSALGKGVTVRNFGFHAANRPLAAVTNNEHIVAVHDASLAPHTEDTFRAPDPAYPDTARAKAFLAALAGLPRLTLVRLGSNETDAALGQIIDGLSRSPYWPKMAVFVLDAAGAAPPLIASPFAKRGATDPTPYNTVSVLRTIELILGLKPMTMHDAGATPMLGSFQNNSNNRNPN